jgi:hypothetical protein
MKKFMTVAAALSVIAFGSCKKEGLDSQTPNKNVQAVVNINLTSGATLPLVIGPDTNYVLNSGTYFLNGKTYVANTGSITIAAGVQIKGIKKATAAEASALVVTRGGKIFANGSSGSPVVFTSAEATPAVGDWGGIVILGNAKTNQNTASFSPTIEGISTPTLPVGIDATFGRADTTLNGESSGALTYVRVEYAGAAIAANNELNSFTFGGVGRGTVVHHLEASYGADDSFEFFGGVVNAKYLASLNTNDDIFDFDFGYNGTLQFILGVRRSGFTYADANGIESDNDATGSSLTPRTQAKVSNMTLIGGSSSAFAGTLNGVRLRRNTSYRIINSVILGYTTGALLESPGTIADSLFFNHNLVHAFAAPVGIGANLGGYNTLFVHATNSNANILLTTPFVTGGSFAPLPASPAVSGADFTGFTGSFFDTSVAYRGAFPVASVPNGNWLAGWSAGF